MATIIDHASGVIYSRGGAAQVAYNWWALLLRGVLAVLVALAAFFLPEAALYGVVFAFGAYALVDGVFNLIAGVRTRTETDRWWTLALQGLLGIGAGVVAFAMPGAAAVAMLFVVAAWAIVTGVLEIAAAIRLRKEIRGEWLLGLSGLASLALGIAMIARPGAGLLAWMFLFGFYALVSGALLIGLGLRMRKLQRRLRVRDDASAADRRPVVDAPGAELVDAEVVDAGEPVDGSPAAQRRSTGESALSN